MNNTKNELSDRRNASADAKAALLESYRKAHSAADPARLARQAERVAVAAAREERRLERELMKRAEAEHRAAGALEQQAIADAAAQAETEARETADRNRIARTLEDEAIRKAARDQRYANRKARRA